VYYNTLIITTHTHDSHTSSTASGLGRNHVLSAILDFTELTRERAESRVSIQTNGEEEKGTHTINIPGLKPSVTVARSIDVVSPHHDKTETTALVAACANGREACVRVLLEFGVDPDVTTSNGTSAVLAVSTFCENHKTRLHILRRLIRANADLNQANDRGITPLNILEKRQEMSALNEIVSAGATDRPTTESWSSTCRYVCRQIKRGKGVSACRDRIMSSKLLPRCSEKDHLWVLMQEDLDDTNAAASPQQSSVSPDTTCSNSSSLRKSSLNSSSLRKSSLDSDIMRPSRVPHRRCYFCRVGTGVGYVIGIDDIFVGVRSARTSLSLSLSFYSFLVYIHSLTHSHARKSDTTRNM